MYQLSVELCQAWLASIVEDEDGINHGGVVVATAVQPCGMSERNAGTGMMQHARGPSLLKHVKLELLSVDINTICRAKSTSNDIKYIAMRPATRFSGAVLRRAVRTPLRAQSPANAVTRATAACKPLPSNATVTRPFHSSVGLRSIMPDAENPAPKKSEEHDQPTAPAEISTEEFHERADAYLNDLVEKLETAQEKDPQIEVEFSVRKSFH